MSELLTPARALALTTLEDVDSLLDVERRRLERAPTPDARERELRRIDRLLDRRLRIVASSQPNGTT